MKKVFVFFLAFIYLAEASGMSLYKHYCMDRLVSWGLTHEGKNCSSCGMAKNRSSNSLYKGCCKDEQKLVKLTDDHKASACFSPLFLLSQVVPNHYTGETTIAVWRTAFSWNCIHAPPFKHKVPFYLFNCVFRI